MKKVLLALSIVLNLVLGGYILNRYLKERAKYNRDISNDSLVVYKYNKYKVAHQREQLLALTPIKAGDIVFVGNSITEGFPVTEMFQNIKVRNRGVAGNSSADILKRIEPIAQAQPAKVFLMVGINDIIQQIPEQRTFNNIDSIISQIKTRSPHTVIYMQSILPFANVEKMPTVIAYNKRIQALCAEKQMPFINLFPYFYNGKIIKPELTVDGMHLQPQGYVIWRDAVQKLVNE